MSSEDYNSDFYKERYKNTVHSAQEVLSIVWKILPEINSVVDFGCGVGTWLSVAKSKGSSDVQGFDGSWVEPELLEIPPENFQAVNLEKPITVNKQYDLAISLEVAEHLSPDVADSFINSLVNASSFVLFSAAIPFQGGIGHINEQWPDYWVYLFDKHGYVVLDIIRKEIWNDKQIPIHYRQNSFLFVKKEHLDKLEFSTSCMNENCLPLAIVHPENYLSKMNHRFTVKTSWKLFLTCVKNWFRRKIQ